MGEIVEIELVILALVYAGAGAAMIRAVFLRRDAVNEWRKAVGGEFDKRAHRFATELELDRAKLPPRAALKLLQSRRVLVAGIGALAIALFLNFLVLRPR
ncbi:MAG: hypothetical protein ABW199_04960 [Caulobacterales bacterium]